MEQGVQKAAKVNSGRRPLRRLGIMAVTVSLLSTTSAGVAIPPAAIATAAHHLSRAMNAMELLAERSPGVRLPGAYSIKSRRDPGPRAAPIPAAEALEGVVGPKSFDLSGDEAPIPAALPLPADVLPQAITAIPQGLAGPTIGPASAPNTPLSSNSIVPIGGGGGGGGGVPPFVNPNPTPTPPPPPPPPSPVPEPLGWAMLLAGFGMVGSMLRHRSLRRAAA